MTEINTLEDIKQDSDDDNKKNNKKNNKKQRNIEVSHPKESWKRKYNVAIFGFALLGLLLFSTAPTVGHILISTSLVLSTHKLMKTKNISNFAFNEQLIVVLTGLYLLLTVTSIAGYTIPILNLAVTIVFIILIGYYVKKHNLIKKLKQYIS